MGWIEARARIIEDNEGKPHHALSFINLVNVFSDLNTLSSFPLTPQIEVENVIICSHLHFIKTSENDVQRHPIFSLMLQLEDLVHVWVSFLVLWMVTHLIRRCRTIITCN